MADMTTDEEIETKKPSKIPLIIGVILGLVGAGGGYFLTSNGLLIGGESEPKQEHARTLEAGPKVAFVPLEPLTISLPISGGDRFLRFRAELEVDKTYVDEVSLFRPRVIDVLNGYLRAVELHDLQNPAALTRLRAQMLRRVQTVTGPGRVNDLLIMEFVVN